MSVAESESSTALVETPESAREEPTKEKSTETAETTNTETVNETDSPRGLYPYVDWKRLPSGAVEHSCVVVTVGESGVGKTSLLVRFATRNAPKDLQSTIGVDFFMCNLVVTPAPRHELHTRAQLWDTAGHERFAQLTRSYLRRADVALLVFDLTNPATAKKLTRWRQEIALYAPACVCVLIGNKLDKCTKKQRETIADFNVLSQRKDFFCAGGFFAVSAHTGERVDVAFVKGITLAHSKRIRQSARPRANINRNATTNESIKSCCNE